MKEFFKSLAVLLIAFCMTLSPALMSMANAGGINYEGFGSYGNHNSSGYDDGQTRGLMFNFSFGGPKDYKKKSSIQDVYKNNLTKHQWVGLGAATLGFIVLILINEDDDECIPYLNGKTIPLYEVPPGYCESGRGDPS